MKYRTEQILKYRRGMSFESFKKANKQNEKQLLKQYRKVLKINYLQNHGDYFEYSYKNKFRLFIEHCISTTVYRKLMEYNYFIETYKRYRNINRKETIIDYYNAVKLFYNEDIDYINYYLESFKEDEHCDQFNNKIDCEVQNCIQMLKNIKLKCELERELININKNKRKQLKI